MAKKKGLLEKKLKTCTINTSSINTSSVYYSIDSTSVSNHNNSLNSYIAGLFEGDGHIWIQTQKGKKAHNPRFCITFAMKNEPLAKKLLDIVGSGFIAYKPKDNACVLVVSPVIGLKRLVNLINGELRTPKIHKLYNLIDWLNKKHGTDFKKLPLNKDNLENSSWLSGFIDADGSFSVQFTKIEDGAKKRKISCRLRIEQRILDPITNESYFDALNQICLFLNCKLLTKTHVGGEYYKLCASNEKSLRIIIDYFTKHPLLSSKYLDYKDWEKVAIYKINRTTLNEKTFEEIIQLKAGMNLKRKSFNWDHLSFPTSIPFGIHTRRNLAIHTRRFSTSVPVLKEPKMKSNCTVIPVKVYEDVDIYKLQVVKENKKKAGVYRFINKTNGKSYIGSSTNLGRRFTQYYSILSLQKEIERGKSLICNSLLKYGYHSFSLEILEYCEVNKATTREQYFLDLLYPEYNILPKAGSSLGHIHSDEAKAKMSLAWTEERKAKHLDALNRLNSSKSQQEHMKNLYLSRKEGSRSEKAGRSKVKMEVFDTITLEKFIYPSLTEAAMAIDYTKEGISLAFNRQEKKGIDFITVKKIYLKKN